MATGPRTAAPTFHEMVFHGPHDLVRGFLAGLAAGSGCGSAPRFAREESIAGHGLGAKLKELAHGQAQVCHLVLDGELRGLLKGSAKRMAAETGLAVLSDRRIRRASFRYTFRAYAPRYGAEIRDLLASLPDGLKVVDRHVEERRDPRAVGVEVYTPAHDYEIEGSGTVVGRYDLVSAARRHLDAHPLLTAGLIELDVG
jgi:hypothetical protein